MYHPGDDKSINFAPGVARGAGSFHGMTAQAAVQFANKHIVSPGRTLAAAVGAVKGKLGLAAVEQLPVDHGRHSPLNADVGVLVHSKIHLVGDDPADGVLVERIAPAGAVAAGGQFPHNVSGGSPGGVLLKDVPHGGGLLLVDAVVLVRPDVVAKAAVAAQGNALERAFPLTAAEFLRQLGGVILGQGFHQTLNDNTLWAVYHRLGGIQNLDPVLPQAGLVDDGVVAAAGEAVCFPADHSVEEVTVAVGDHLLERRAAVALAGNVAVDILMGASFKVVNVAPMVLINVLDPNKHKKNLDEKTVQINSGVAVLEEKGVLLDKLVVKAESATLTAGTDYTAAFDDNGYVNIVVIPGGAGKSATSLTVSGVQIDPSAVTPADIVGAVSAAGVESGMECIRMIFPKLNMVPGILIAPGWSENAIVSAGLQASLEIVTDQNKKQDDRLTELEKAPGAFGNKLWWTVIAALISGIVAYELAAFLH